MPEVDQQTVEKFRAAAAYIEESIERHEAALEDLHGELREEVAARIRWRRRELQAILDMLDQLEEDLFAITVLAGIKRL